MQRFISDCSACIVFEVRRRPLAAGGVARGLRAGAEALEVGRVRARRERDIALPRPEQRHDVELGRQEWVGLVPPDAAVHGADRQGEAIRLQMCLDQ